MTRKEKSLTGRIVRLEKNSADRASDLNARLQDTTPAEKSQDFQTYRRAVRRMLANAYVTLREFPARLRFSWVVDRHGRLRPLTADEGGAR